MIRANSFEKAWILESVANAKQRGVATDPLLMEKNIYALHLLELISTLDFSFVFKGGTALILLFGEPTRFSIDIDIQTGSEETL